MKSLAKYLFIATLSAFAFASCDKAPENEMLNPKGTPVQFTFTARTTSETEATLKVVSNVPVPADVAIALAVDPASTMKSGMSFPSELVMKAGESEVTGQLVIDKDALVPGTTTTAKLAASVAGVVFGSAEANTITIEPKEEPKPEPTGDSDIKIDGEFSDWDDVKTVLISEDESKPLKAFKVAFDKEYIYFYHKRNNDPAMWGGGYYYFFVDTDNNVATGPADRDNLIGLDKWMYLYFFLGSSEAPEIPDAPAGATETEEYACAANALAGKISEDVVETEIRIPLADLGITYGSTIKVYTSGNKSASNLRSQPIVVNVGGEAPKPSFAVDGNFDEWEDIEGVSNGNYIQFKVGSDEENLYFYSYRGLGGRYSALWGGEGYLYLGFELDGDETNGVELNGNGMYDFIGFFFPYGGTAEAPAIIETPGEGGGWLPEEFTLANMKCKGVANDEGAFIEYSIPRADLPAIPNTTIEITSWGNKDMNKVTIDCRL